MSMNVVLVAEGLIITPNGKTKNFYETFDVLQTSTDESYRIISHKNIYDQLREYKEAVKNKFQNQLVRFFESSDDEYEYYFNGNESVSFITKVETAEELLEEHMKNIHDFVEEHLSQGFDVKFHVV